MATPTNWNLLYPNMSQGTASYQDPSLGAGGIAQQPAQAPQRWSYHLENMPTYLQGQTPDVQQYFKTNFYDNQSADPNAALGNLEQRYWEGTPTDQREQTDATTLASQNFLNFAMGKGGNFASLQPQGQQPQSPTQAWNQQPSSPEGATLMSLLLSRAQQGTQVGPNDPNVRNQVDPAVAQLERSKRNYLGDVAERAGPLGNIRGEERMANERFGQQAGLLQSQVIGREIDARRQEIQSALSMLGARLSDTERQGLERELAYLNDRARTADRSTSNDQFLRDLALREWGMVNQDDLIRSGIY